MVAVVNDTGLITYSDLLWQLALQPSVPLDRPRQDDLRGALERWFDAPATRPQGVSSADWLSWEQEKHQRLLALAEAA
jgi:hypothetical protein